MPTLDRLVAGLRCREVLADLSDFLDGLLVDARFAAIRSHLAGCRECDRFGQDVADVLASVRAVAEPPALPPDVEHRLRARLDAELARERPR